jgi:GDSL-like Lipase/Acylhydrolase family
MIVFRETNNSHYDVPVKNGCVHLTNSPYLKAAWSGKTIQYITDHIGTSLAKRPNIVLIHAGTNDLNPNPNVSTEGNDPREAAERLGALIDRIIQECPDAVILVAIIISTCDENQQPGIAQFQSLIPGIVEKRRVAGRHVVAVDFTTFSAVFLRDCIHPTEQGYKILGDYWFKYINQIPAEWIKQPVYIHLRESQPSLGISSKPGTALWQVFEGASDRSMTFCSTKPIFSVKADSPGPLPLGFGPFKVHGLNECVYIGTKDDPGVLACPGHRMLCFKDEEYRQSTNCWEQGESVGKLTHLIQCMW